MLPGKIVLISLVVIALTLFVYLNRSYANIYSYNQALPYPAFQSRYKIEGGKGQAGIKYAALGDSLTYGTGASEYKNSFPYIFGKKLLDRYKNVEVINLGIPGATAKDVLFTQVPKALEEQPGLITIMVGTNDVHNFTDLNQFGNSLDTIIEKLKVIPDSQIVLINIPYLGTENLIAFPYNYLMDKKIREFNEVTLNTASKKDVRYFDLYNKSRQDFKENPDLYSPDNFHPSDKGYILWGNLINAN